MHDAVFLEHVGILGMKWGKRKGHTSSNPPSKKSLPPASSDHTKKTNLQKKNVRTLSNDQIRELTSRLQLEKQLKDLNKADVSSGKKFVKEVFVGAAKQTATTFVAKQMSVGVEALIKKAANNAVK